MADVKVEDLFNKVGRMYMEISSQNLELVALRQQNGELSRVAGECLRAVEALGRKDIADNIVKGRKWHVALAQEEAAEAPEGGLSGPGLPPPQP